MSYVEYDYGSSVLAEGQAKKLQPLAKALKERPNLKLEVEGYVDGEKDREGLKNGSFQAKLKAQKLQELIRQGKEAPPVEAVVIGADEYEKVLKAAYDAEKFPKPRDTAGKDKILPPPEMEKLMLTHIEVKENDLRLLASRRALNVRNALLASGEVTPDRVFLIEAKSLQPEAKEKVANSRVDFRLK
jgi:flagellar motor protein MotB